MQQQLILYLACAWTLCAGSGDWCYQSQFSCDHQCNAPENWDHASRNCAGRSQSPVNIVTRKTVKDDRLTPLKFENYQHIFRGLIKNNGHSVQVGVSHPSTISGGGLSTTYKAVQFHLHWGNNGGPGSEHTIDGEQYPMEIVKLGRRETEVPLKAAIIQMQLPRQMVNLPVLGESPNDLINPDMET